MLLLKHDDNTDVAVEILKQFYVARTQTYKFKVRWWNIVPSHPPYCMWLEQTIRVAKKDMHKWKPYR